MEASSLKMYIAVREEVPAHMVPVCVAHAMLRADDRFTVEDPFAYIPWKTSSFKKVVVSVNDKEWGKIVVLPRVVQTHENSTLNGENCVAVISPRKVIPNVLKFAKMWKP